MTASHAHGNGPQRRENPASGVAGHRDESSASHADNSVKLVIDRHPPLSPNRTVRMNRWERTAHNRLWRQEALAAWMNAGQPQFDRVRVTVTLYSRGDRVIQDEDNAYAAVKPILDGLKGRLVPDDSRRHIPVIGVRVAVDNAHPRVEIEIEESG